MGLPGFRLNQTLFEILTSLLKKAINILKLVPKSLWAVLRAAGTIEG